MEPLLITAKQIRELIGISENCFKYFEGFPKPVNIHYQWDMNQDFAGNRWRLKDVKKWVEKLETKK